MANSDVIVSSEEGTILNYFGIANTYNPFTNENAMQIVEDLTFQIPSKTAGVKDEAVAVSTGLITTSVNFTNNCIFQIIDNESGAVITELKNIIGEVGNSLFLPNESQIFWFNIDSLRGTFYVNKKHLGQKLKLVRGLFITTSITSGVLNDMFARTVGVPKYIQEIQNLVKNIPIPYSKTEILNSAGTITLEVPENFIGKVAVGVYATSIGVIFCQSDISFFSGETLILTMPFIVSAINYKGAYQREYLTNEMVVQDKITKIRINTYSTNVFITIQQVVASLLGFIKNT